MEESVHGRENSPLLSDGSKGTFDLKLPDFPKPSS